MKRGLKGEWTGGFSLRAKFALLALLNVTILGITLLLFVRHQLGQEFQSFLMATAREKILAVSKQLTLDLTDAGDREAILERYKAAYAVEFRLYDSRGLRIAGPDTPIPAEVAARLVRPVSPRPRSPTGLGSPPFLMEGGEPSRYWIGVRILLPSPDVRHSVPATLILVSPTLLSNSFFFDWEPWLAILATAVLVTALCWFPLVRGLTRDIGKMTDTTAAVSDGNFDVRLDTRRSDELGRLGGSINQMTTRLRDFVDGQRRFLGDVAHELRSPLGRIQVALGLLERKIDPAERRYIRDLEEDVELLSGLTTELLAFARSELKREPVPLAPVVLRDIVERAVNVEAPEGMVVGIDVAPSMTVWGEDHLLFRSVSNLVRNAIHYGGGDVSVTASWQGEQVALRVSDRGPGVPEEALERIFTPFFRLDSARGRKKGGTGLGLAIVRNQVEACGGRVQARNRAEGGLEIVVTLRRAE